MVFSLNASEKVINGILSKTGTEESVTYQLTEDETVYEIPQKYHKKIAKYVDKNVSAKVELDDESNKIVKIKAFKLVKAPKKKKK